MLFIRRRPAEYDVPVGLQLVDLRVFDRLEVGHARGAELLVLDPLEQAVLRVAFFLAGIEQLRRKQVLVLARDLDVDVRGSAHIRRGLDRAEVVLAGRGGEELAVALEVLVALLLVAAADPKLYENLRTSSSEAADEMTRTAPKLETAPAPEHELAVILHLVAPTFMASLLLP